MLFMVIEHWNDVDKVIPIFQRYKDERPRPPEGITILHSWAEANWDRMFSAVDCDDPALLQAWALDWKGYGVRWEFIPITNGADTFKAVGPHLKP